MDFSQTDYLDKILHFRGRESTECQVVIIGACDGYLDEVLIGYIRSYGWKSLWVEPIPDRYEKLKENLKGTQNSHFDNRAVTDQNGTATLIYIPISETLKGPRYLLGTSTLKPVKNILADQYHKLQKNIVVPSVTLSKLLSDNQIDRLDFLEVDIDGHEFMILNQLDLDQWKPQGY